MQPLRAIPFLAVLLLCLTLPGCLEVDGQEITIRRDEAADRIDVHVVHRGLFAENGQGSSNDPLAKAVKDLADVRAGGEVVFWCNWPVTFDLTREYPAPAQALLAHVDVENGGLFTDHQSAEAVCYAPNAPQRASSRLVENVRDCTVVSDGNGGRAYGDPSTWGTTWTFFGPYVITPPL